jgi:YVTN family beta-propeller protein
VIPGHEQEVFVMHPRSIRILGLAAATSATLALAGAGTGTAAGAAVTRAAAAHPVTAYVASSPSAVTPINTATNKAGKAITVGEGPVAIAITPNGKTAYVANIDPGTVTPIRTATNTALKAIKVGPGPAAIAITPNGKTAYVANDGIGEVLGHTVTPLRTAPT